jgi:SAM-dependent methyltransferase
MVHHNNCPLCSSENIAPYLKCTDHLVSRQVFELVTCRSCSFVFTQDYPDESESAGYYESDDYISHTDAGKALTDKTYHAVRKFMLARKRKLVMKLSGKQAGSILDIGSGTGHFLNEMKCYGWTAEGVEINDKARQFSIEHFGLKVISPGELSSLPRKSFDCISLWHALEHFHNPGHYLEEIKRLLRPGGVLIVALPNCESADAGYYREHWAAYDVPRHLWHFSPGTIRSFLGKSGFELKQYRMLPADVFYISVLSEKHRGSGISLLSGLLIGTWFSLLSLLSKKKSSSLFYIFSPSGSVSP